MAELKVKDSSLEWKINLPEGSVGVKHAHKGFHYRFLHKICEITSGWKLGFVSVCKKIYKLGADDPRRVIHAMKVGLGLAMVSILYFMNKLFASMGGTLLWAVMTVVVVFQFTAGGTLRRGLNRMCATLLGGSLAVGVTYVAASAGHKIEPIILVVAVFTQGAATTFARFNPKIKARYDYGLLVFNLTFSFMTISAYRVENLFVEAYQRLATIIIGCVLCILISLVIFPIWAGDDLHKLIIHNMEGLAQSCEGCVTQFFRGGDRNKDKVSKGYKCVLNSTSSEESLANFARWEPAHGAFGLRYPWVQYVKVGAAMRGCAYYVQALNGCLNSETMVPSSMQSHMAAACMRIAAECSKVLIQLAGSIKTMTNNHNSDLMIDQLNTLVEELHNCLISHPELFIDNKRWEIVSDGDNEDYEANNLLQSSIHNQVKNVEKTIDKNGREDSEETAIIVNIMDGLALATIVCLLKEIVGKLSIVIKAVEELGKLANFKSAESKQFKDTIVPHLQKHISLMSP